MRFLLDVHIAAGIGRALAGSGHDVLSAVEAHADRTDADLLDLAVREQRIMVTEDRDFSDLVFRDGAVSPPAVIYLRCGAAEQAGLAERLLLVLANVDPHGHMVVIERMNVRTRPLPEKQNSNA